MTTSSRVRSIFDANRGRSGRSVNEFADALGISRQSIYRILAADSQPLPVERLQRLAGMLGVPYAELRDASLRDAGYFTDADPVRRSQTAYLVSSPALDGVMPICAFTDVNEAERYAEVLDEVDGGAHEVDTLTLDSAEWPEPAVYFTAAWSHRAGRIRTSRHVGRQLPSDIDEVRVSYASQESTGVNDAIYMVFASAPEEQTAIDRVADVLRDAPDTGPGALADPAFNANAGSPVEALEYSIAYAKDAYGRPAASGDGAEPSKGLAQFLPPSVSEVLRTYASPAPADNQHPPQGDTTDEIQRRTIVVRPSR